MSFSPLVSLGSKFVRFFFLLGIPIEGIIRRTIFAQFCGGETIAECSETIRDLAQYHIGTILDYSVEGIQREKDFDETSREIIRTIDLAEANPSIPFCVFKITGIARFDLLQKVNAKETLTPKESAEWERARHRLSAICLNASQKRVRIFIDAEESWIQDAIDALAMEMMRVHNRDETIVYNTVQMYRSDRMDYLRQSVAFAPLEKFFYGVKIVRGAYMEKERARAQARGLPSPILPDKASTDRNYDEALKFCVDHLEVLSFCAGTHNEKSTRALVSLMAQKGIRPDDKRIFFSQLLGMSDHLSYNLAAEGYNVAKYVPYGPVPAMMPYLLRRAEENTAIAGQTTRELSLITQELQRRKTTAPRRVESPR